MDLFPSLFQLVQRQRVLKHLEVLHLLHIQYAQPSYQSSLFQNHHVYQFLKRHLALLQDQAQQDILLLQHRHHEHYQSLIK